ncbi:hypothetical protein PF005_g17138 [Phytophthora fragariae]|uniref:Uncharacterized protein n=1 Tax=Phytophthora fragariae TaxID=53985 RepID=A0A6A3ET18_9STRA|nr:hypothetical protein PF003_g29633 [Phytophthora fragariae]KAE8933148.1 hypothetical protein PF009_g16834 [Phytophthora fragariae]KAE8987179.1 hypothetical protein PF011_g19672 [Phytophthora fragariae]KAE9087569.1 hypothetical protein PF007_g20328 [Phytophthora fragariae]KAE9087586.1 hypothetical protein PF010_g19679 [Phytophthora fragariae]
MSSSAKEAACRRAGLGRAATAEARAARHQELPDGRRAEAGERGAGGRWRRRAEAAETGAEDEELELMEIATDATTGESIVDVSWHPSKNLLAVAQLN